MREQIGPGRSICARLEGEASSELDPTRETRRYRLAHIDLAQPRWILGDIAADRPVAQYVMIEIEPISLHLLQR